MSNKLFISDDLSLPANAITQTFAILGIRGSGKTNTAVVMFEEMVKQGDQCVVLDPTDAWYGVRSSADGKAPGLQVYVFGGEHGDLPLEGTYGSQMADFVIDSGASVVFSLRHLSMADQRRFAADFGERLRFLKAKPENRNPLQIFLDEAEEFVPQNIRESDPNTARMFGAYNRMVRRDRNLGLGITLISQRPQSVNKEPLSQIETLICHRLLHKLDRKSVKESWVEGHDTAGIGEKFLDSLASLERGDVWVWSPFWLDIFKKIHIRHRETFDSSATPKTGERQKVVKVRAAVDLDVLRQKLSETIDKAKANDPTYLKRRILELEKAIKSQPTTGAAASSADLDKAYEAGRRDLLTQIKGVRLQLERDTDKFAAASTRQNFQDLPNFMQSIFARMKELAATLPGADTSANRPATVIQQPARPVQSARPAPATRPSNGHGESLPKGEQIILCAIAQYPEGAQRDQLTVLTGYKRSTRDTYIQRLREKSFVVDDGRGVFATEAGIAALGSSYEPLPTGEALQQYWLNRLPEGERRIFSALLSKPEGLSRESLEEMTGYKRSTRDTYIQRLQSRRLVEIVGRGEVRPSEMLFA
jgi:hypothetical protein